ncbi:hypothetical protein AMTR_s00036p00108740 [Amborella trichopoda]|uniref:SRP54-type proteins GTP-binding domain-containing protein n=1 Tax=Amborella trichopoda TaxID=13333 RepID=U5D1P4_AMBTC|nr:hypothetical protein AMTR_s00036p00108740 [Amborella trichopoda]
MEEAFLLIFTQKHSVDFEGVHAAKEQGKPYVVVFVVVIGVGKSANLVKVKIHDTASMHKISVMMAACDICQSGAVEQPCTHARKLQELFISIGIM